MRLNDTAGLLFGRSDKPLWWRDFVQYQMSVKGQPCRNQRGPGN